jgi:GT2 family glycosyltransferase
MSETKERPSTTRTFTSADADVSIVLPYYRSHQFFAATLESIADQDCRIREVVVIDDGTPPRRDGSPDTRCEEILAAYPDVTLAHQPNQGPGAARHAGMLLTTAPYVMFLDCDDRITPGGLACLRTAMKEHPDWGMVSGRAMVIDEDGDPTGMNMLPQPTVDDLYGEMLERSYICPPGSALFRRAALDAVGGWKSDPRRWGVEDYDVYLRVARHGPIGTVQDVVNEYRRHASSQGQPFDRLLQSIVSVLEDEAEYTSSDPTHDAARRRGLAYWEREFNLRGREHAIRAAWKAGSRVKAARLAAAYVLRYPLPAARSAYQRGRAEIARRRAREPGRQNALL